MSAAARPPEGGAPSLGEVVAQRSEGSPISARARPSEGGAPLGRAAIEARIPHRGAMCLLESVDAWDAQAICCRAASHRDPHHPLREEWGLPATAAIEYAAQAMAIHGALLAGTGEAPRKGYLASVRSVEIRIDRLDGIAGDLEIRAERLMGDDANVLYTFTVGSAGECLVSGRAAVILDAGRRSDEAPGSPA